MVADAAGMARSLRGPAAFFYARSGNTIVIVGQAPACRRSEISTTTMIQNPTRHHPTMHTANNTRSRHQLRSGFTLTEAVVALSVATMSAAMILLAVDTTLVTTSDSVDETIAVGMAKQLIDEVMSTRYNSPGSPTDYYQYPLTANAWEQSGNGRERFNDTDDFNNYVVNGATGVWGFALGEGDGAGGLRPASMRTRPGEFSDWRQEISVYYVAETNFGQKLGPYETSDYRCVEVVISKRRADGNYRELTRLRRVFTYVPRH